MHIAASAEEFTQGSWHPLKDTFESNSVELFSMLVSTSCLYTHQTDTGQSFQSIAELRGLPRETSISLEGKLFSFFSIRELSDYSLLRVAKCSGIVPVEHYLEQRCALLSNPPKVWFGSLDGASVISSKTAEKYYSEDKLANSDVTHVRVSWFKNYEDCEDGFFTVFISSLVNAYPDKHIRVVVAFSDL